MTLSSECILKNVFISSSSQYIKMSDNYFDLFPGNPVKVVLKNGDLKALEHSLRFRSYRQVYEAE